MLRFLVLIILVFGLNCICQCQLKSHWQISSSFGVSERNSKLNPDYEITSSFNPESIINFRNNVEKPGFSFMLDFRKVKSLKERLGFVFGVGISSLARKSVQEATENLDDPRLLTPGLVVFGDYDYLKVRRSDFFLSIPLGIHYMISDKESWYIQGTINPNIYLSSQSKTTFERIEEENNVSKNFNRNSTFSSLNLSPELLVGVNVLNGQNKSLNLALFGQWMMFSGFERDSPYIQKRYFTGVRLGVNFKTG